MAIFAGGFFTAFNTFDSIISLFITAFFVLLIVFALRFTTLFEHAVNRQLIAFVLFFQLGCLFFEFSDFRKNPENNLFQHENVVFSGVVHEVRSEKEQSQQFIVQLDQLIIGEKSTPTNAKILVNLYDASYHVNDKLLFNGTVSPLKNKGNPGEFDARYYYQYKGIIGTIALSNHECVKIGETQSINGFFTRWRNALSKSMEQHLDGVFLGVAKALLLGDKADLDQETMRIFSNTGSMHVLAVSGLHVGLLLMMFQKVLLLFARWISKRQALFLSLLLVWIYGFLSGASPSVMRAVVMFTILAYGQLFFRKTAAINSLCLSAILLFVWDPWVIFDIGFQLSYGAMFGIFLLYQPLVDLLHVEQKLVRMIWEGTMVGIAATIFTTPLTLYWFYQFPNYFALANLGVMLFGFLVLLLGMIYLITVYIPVISVFVAVVFSFTIIGLVWWVGIIDQLPGAVSGGFHFETSVLLIAYLLIIGWLIAIYRYKRLRYLLIPVSILSVVLVSVQRYDYLTKNELIVFKAKRLVCAIKTEDGVLGFFDPKKELAAVVPRELLSYQQYSGRKMKTIPLVKDSVVALVGHSPITVVKVSNGWNIHLRDTTLYYQQYGIPTNQHNPRLLSSYLQEYLNPTNTWDAFVLSY
jgi:competence protein ComEC